MNKLTSCHKFLPAAILLALLVCGNSQTSSAQSGGLSASLGGGGGGGLSIGGQADASLTAGGSSGSGSGTGASITASLGGGAGSSGAAGSGLSGSIGLGGSEGGSSISSSLGGGALGGSGGSSPVAASVQVSASTTPKPEGLFSKMKEIVKSSVDSLTGDKPVGGSASATPNGGAGEAAGSAASTGGQKSEGGLIEKIGDVAKRGKEMVKESAHEVKEMATSAKDDVKSLLKPSESKLKTEAKALIGEGAISKMMSKGSDMVHKIENKASEIGDKITKPLLGEGKGEGHESLKEKITGAKAGSHLSEEKGLAVEVMDKMHEVSKSKLELAMKPIDKVLGLKEDPIVKVMDESHGILRHPLSIVSKPVDKVLSGAFKTSDESKLEQERLMSEQEKRELKLHEERARREGRTVLGEISDKTIELAEKPFEIVLKPIDHILGFDKDGKKNPLIRIFDKMYGLSKKPVDKLARPIENILKKMADGEQAYQVSVRLSPESGASVDPKLFTRIADGALNIADRVITLPIEFAMRPFGYGADKKRNPLVDAAHSLKNATKVGFELFTKPIDRIIKEIAEIGQIKDDSEREAIIERKRQEASRIVSALDKLHEVAQTPFEIVLKPIGKVFGYNREGKKEPLLRAWDVVHEVVRTPVQVFSKPVEDAILGEPKRAKIAAAKAKLQAEGKNGASAGSRGAAASAGAAQAPRKKNFIVESIKKVEKMAVKPISVITSPIRRLILGQDGKAIEAKAKAGGAQAKAQLGKEDGQDKIVKTVEALNNVVLKPLEFMTQPISDVLSPEDSKPKAKVDVKLQGASQMKGQEKPQASMSVTTSNHSSGSGSGSGAGSGSASGSTSGSSSGLLSGSASGANSESASGSSPSASISMKKN